jgi:hypothetical protein
MKDFKNFSQTVRIVSDGTDTRHEGGEKRDFSIHVLFTCVVRSDSRTTIT